MLRSQRAAFELPDHVLNRDWTQPYVPSPEVEAAWAEVYRDTHNGGISTSSPKSCSMSTTPWRPGAIAMR